jgi:hypothetical protein
MIKLQAPSDHNWTHCTHPRTLWEAFQGRGDMYISEAPLISEEDKPFVLQLCIIGLVSLVVFLLWG